MNFTETFQDFSSRLTTTDLALYAGAALVVWVLFKEKLSPVQKPVGALVDHVKNLIGSNKRVNSLDIPVVVNVKPGFETDDLFFKLVVSWKQTRDLAVKSNCEEAVKVADQMFPYLSPTVCAKKGSLS